MWCTSCRVLASREQSRTAPHYYDSVLPFGNCALGRRRLPSASERPRACRGTMTSRHYSVIAYPPGARIGATNGNFAANVGPSGSGAKAKGLPAAGHARTRMGATAHPPCRPMARAHGRSSVMATSDGADSRRSSRGTLTISRPHRCGFAPSGEPAGTRHRRPVVGNVDGGDPRVRDLAKEVRRPGVRRGTPPARVNLPDQAGWASFPSARGRMARLINSRR